MKKFQKDQIITSRIKVNYFEYKHIRSIHSIYLAGFADFYEITKFFNKAAPMKHEISESKDIGSKQHLGSLMTEFPQNYKGVFTSPHAVFTIKTFFISLVVNLAKGSFAGCEHKSRPLKSCS